MTVIVYITYDNLQDIDAGRSLPVGVTEVELKNWTKTREPDEIESGEKKLNSHSTYINLIEILMKVMLKIYRTYMILVINSEGLIM